MHLTSFACCGLLDQERQNTEDIKYTFGPRMCTWLVVMSKTGVHGKNKLQKQNKYISYKIYKTNSCRQEGKNTQRQRLEWLYIHKAKTAFY
jgi:hypothetical protein